MLRLFQFSFIILSFLPALPAATAPASHVISGKTLPTKCSPGSGDIFNVFSGTSPNYIGLEYYCDSLNHWTSVAGSFTSAGVVELTPATITGDVNNYAPTGQSSTTNVLRLCGDASHHITGLDASILPNRIQIRNICAFTLILDNASGSSSVGNQFGFPVGNISLAGGAPTGAAINLVYTTAGAGPTKYWELDQTESGNGITSATLRGDGAGGTTAVTGTGTDCVLVNGGSGSCGGAPISGATATAIVTAASATTLQTPNASSTLDAGGNITVNSVTSSGTTDGMIQLTAKGSTPATSPNSFGWAAPDTMTTSQVLQSPNAVSSAHSLMIIGAPTSNISTFAYKVIPDCQDTGGNHLNFTQSSDTINCGTSGGGIAGATLFSSVGTGTGPNNTATETSVIPTVATGSKTIAANTFGNGTILQVWASGYFSLPAVSDSLTMRYKCGSTVIGSASFTFAAGALTNGVWRLTSFITGSGTGAGGSFMTNTIFEGTGGALTATESKMLNTSTVAYDFTTSCAFDVTAQWGAAQMSESMQGTNVAALIPGSPVSSVFGQTGAVGNLSGDATTNGSSVVTVVKVNGNTPSGTCTGVNAITSLSSSAVGTCSVPTPTNHSISAAYTTVLGDANTFLYHPSADTTARTWTIDSNANVAYPVNTCLTFFNDTSAGTLTIAITTDTMILAGAGTTGSRTLAASGVATACKMTTTRWIINGTGLT